MKKFTEQLNEKSFGMPFNEANYSALPELWKGAGIKVIKRKTKTKMSFTFESVDFAKKAQQGLFQQGFASKEDLPEALAEKVISKALYMKLVNPPVAELGAQSEPDTPKGKESTAKATKTSEVTINSVKSLKDLNKVLKSGYVLKDPKYPEAKISIDAKTERLIWKANEEQKRAWWCSIPQVSKWLTIERVTA